MRVLTGSRLDSHSRFHAGGLDRLDEGHRIVFGEGERRKKS